MHNSGFFLTIIKFLNVGLMNFYAVLMISAKMALSGLIKITALWSKTSSIKFYHVIQIIL